MPARSLLLTGRKARGKLLDEFVEITGWRRKHANKVLFGTRCSKGRRIKCRAPHRYGGDPGDGTFSVCPFRHTGAGT